MKKIYLLGIFAIMAIALTCMVNAAAGTFVTPTADEYIRGNYNFNVSMTSWTTGFNSTNMSLKIDGVEVCTDRKITDDYNRTYFNCSYWTTALSDTATYSITARVWNESLHDSYIDIAAVTVNVDNTKPICTLNSQSSSTSYDPTDTTWTMTYKNTTSCKLRFDSNLYAGTKDSSHLTGSCTYSSMEEPPADVYSSVRWELSDGYNTTLCTALTSVTVEDTNSKSRSAGVIAVAIGTDTTQQSITTKTVGKINVMWIALFIILVVVFIAYNKKTK